MHSTIGNAAHRNSGDEVELMRNIKARDVEALEELYDLYNQLLFGLILSIVKKREEAERLLQEIFVTIWEKAESFNEEQGNVFSWILGLTRNKAIAHIRKNEEQTGQSGFSGSMSHHDPMGTTIFSDRAELVKRALDELPTKQSEIIRNAYYRGLTRSEIAGSLGIPVDTVKNRIREGMNNLNRILSGYISTDG